MKNTIQKLFQPIPKPNLPSAILLTVLDTRLPRAINLLAVSDGLLSTQELERQVHKYLLDFEQEMVGRSQISFDGAFVGKVDSYTATVRQSPGATRLDFSEFPSYRSAGNRGYAILREGYSIEDSRRVADMLLVSHDIVMKVFGPLCRGF